jgi:hypothetical protein
MAHSALRSLVSVAKEFPSAMLFSECAAAAVESSSHDHACAIFSSLIFVYDQASLCSDYASLECPDDWSAVAEVLARVAESAMDTQTWHM